MMTIDKQIILDTNEVLKELFLSRDKEAKEKLLNRFINIDLNESPHKMNNWSMLDTGLARSYILESPKRRLSLKKFSPDKIDLELLIFRSYFLLEFSFYNLISAYSYTHRSSDHISQAVQFGLSYFSSQILTDPPRAISNPLNNFAGTFFETFYPYDVVVELIISDKLW